MQFTFFSFVMSLLWFNLYIVVINTFRKKDNFIISFSTLPLIFFLFLSIFRLIFNFEIPGSRIIESRSIFPKVFDFIRGSLHLNGFNIKVYQVLIIIWIIGIIILLLNNITKYIKFKKTFEELDNNISGKDRNIFNEILEQKKIENKIEIVQNDNVSSPFILGILKGKIYIPNIYFSKEELEYIILHEINHFLEKDSLKKILIQGIKYVFWWNPFAHLFVNNFNHILEIQCDLETTAGFVDDEKIRYLESMTKIIKNSTNLNTEYSIIPNLVSIKDADSLKQRFRIVLNYKGEKALFSILNVGLCVVALCLFIASYFLIIQPRYEPTANDIYIEDKINDSFIIEKSDGSYDIYINNGFRYSIDDLDDLTDELQDVPIYKGND